MPYSELSDLPASVKDHLPKHAQEIYMKAYNDAWKQYRDSSKRRGNSSHEGTASRVAWTAVRKQYKKDKSSGRWKRKES